MVFNVLIPLTKKITEYNSNQAGATNINSCYVYMRYGTIGDGRCTILLFPTCPQSSLRFRRLHVAGNDFIVRDFCRAFTWGIVRESSKGVRYYRTPYANYRTRLGTIANYHTSCKRLKRRDDWEQMGNCSYNTSDANIKGAASYRSRTISLSGNNHFCSQLLLVHIEGLRNITSLTFEMKIMCPSRNICSKHTFSWKN